MKVYQSKYDKLSGTSRDEVMKDARKTYHIIQKHTKRQPYVRSVYFRKDKIFINTFWHHLAQKRRSDQVRRLKFYPCAIDLLRHTRFDSDTILKAKKLDELLHRFAGKSKDGELFYVQVKQNKKSGRKDFISVFPGEELPKRKRPSAG
ncbi:MAG: hypothetical protein ACR2FM_04150 [Candidatus Saccharimonadales bacterium]